MVNSAAKLRQPNDLGTIKEARGRGAAARALPGANKLTYCATRPNGTLR